MDVFAEHGIAGVVGLLFNALFATSSITGLDGVTTGLPLGGWLIHNYKQFYIQFAYILACGAYSFVMSAILAFAINKLPGLRLRADEAAELLGMDDDQLGEFAYDYVEVRRDYLAWTPARGEMEKVEVGVEPGERHGIREHGEMATSASAPRGSASSAAGTQGTLVSGERLGGVEENENENEKLGSESGGSGSRGEGGRRSG
jgi:ammonium transporter, Amt family